MHLQEVLADYFSLYLASDARRHLASYHPHALVLDGSVARRAAEVDPNAFARRHSERAGAGIPLRAYQVEHIEARDFRTLVRVRLELHDAPRALLVAVCVHGPELGVRAVALDPAGDLTDVQLEALAAAEFAFLPPDSERYVTGLDLAYARRLASEASVIASLPEARFTCHMSGKCCSGALGIGVSRAARLAFEQVDWARLVAVTLPDPFLVAPEDPALPHRIATHDDRCVFLDEGQCSIHSSLGTPFNPTCVTFPLSFVVTPDGAQATGSFTCPSVKGNRGALLKDRQEDLHQRLWLWGQEATVIGAEVPYRQGRGKVAWPLYRSLEAGWLSLLDDLPLADALARGLQALRSLGDPERWTLEAVEQGFKHASAFEAALPKFRGIDLLGAMLYGFLSQYEPEAFTFGVQPPEAFQFVLHAFLPTTGVVYRPDPTVLRRYLRETLYRKRLLGELGVVETFHFILLAAAFLRSYAEFLAYRAGRSETTGADFDRALEALETASHHSPGFSRLLGADASIRACLASATFADGLLALVQR